MYTMRAIPKRAILTLDSSDGTMLTLECVAAETSSTFEIGKKHFFANKKSLGFASRRRGCALYVRIRPKSSVNEEAIARLSRPKIKLVS